MKKVQLIGMVALLSLFVACAKPAAPAITPAPSGATSAVIAKPAWEVEWERTLGEARKEGRVMAYLGTGTTTRQALMDGFRERYGVEADIVTDRGAGIAERVLRENLAGLRASDVIVDGRNTVMNALKPAGVLGPVEPLLLLPEVRDPQAWFGGQLPLSPDGLSFLSTYTVAAPIAINTDMVKAIEVTSMRDLLNPKWKGKIIMGDPTIGTTLNWFASFSDVLGYDYMKALATMEPAVTPDKRLFAETVARGKYAIGIGLYDDVSTFIELGAPLALVVPKEGATISAGAGCIYFLAKSPHPNAAKLFLNWILSREGQTAFGRSSGVASNRVDVPTDYLLAAAKKQPGIEYYTTEGEEYALTLKEKQNMAKQIFGSLVR
ncbi:MAG: extracellular solute-binding protein [Chloroflexi bacterium]|nr:extracellular solute-binding protein [Chloroflexota bacterium]